MVLLNKAAYLAGLILLGVGVQVTHVHLDQTSERDTSIRAEVLPSEEALNLVSLSYANVVADYYWLRSISDFGTDAQQDSGFPNLGGLTSRVIALDPDFEAAYSFAGKALTVKEGTLPEAMKILAEGRKRFPTNWDIASLQGFNAYMYLQDFGLAAEAYAAAGRQPDAPPVFGQFATKLAAEAQKPEVGLMLVNHMLDTLEDETLIAFYEERRSLLILEQSLIDLQERIDRFERIEGRAPTGIDELLQRGLIQSIPEKDPLGGRYFIDESGQASTTSESLRLRLSDKARETLQ